MVAFPHPQLKVWDGFPNVYYEILVNHLEVNSQKCGAPYGWVSLKVLTLRLVLSEPPAIWKFQFSLSYPSSGSSEFFVCKLYFGDTRLPVCLSYLGYSGLPSFLTSIIDPKSIIDFSVCSTVLLEQSGNFQAPYMWNWKLLFGFLKLFFPRY